MNWNSSKRERSADYEIHPLDHRRDAGVAECDLGLRVVAAMTYTLGKWWLESGPYRAWEADKLAHFAITHTLIKTERIDTHDGGLLLLAEAEPKNPWLEEVEKANDAEVGCQCPECQWCEGEMKRGNYAVKP